MIVTTLAGAVGVVKQHMETKPIHIRGLARILSAKITWLGMMIWAIGTILVKGGPICEVRALHPIPKGISISGE